MNLHQEVTSEISLWYCNDHSGIFHGDISIELIEILKSFDSSQVSLN